MGRLGPYTQFEVRLFISSLHHNKNQNPVLQSVDAQGGLSSGGEGWNGIETNVHYLIYSHRLNMIKTKLSIKCDC